MDRRRFVVCLIALILPFIACEPILAQTQVGVNCIPRAAESTFGHINVTDGTNMLDTAEIQAMVGWQGSSLWVGYPQGWARPLGAEVLLVYLSREGHWNGAVELYYNIQFPDEYAVLPYATLEPFADARGEHWGKHPKCAFTIPRIVVDAWLLEVSS